MFNQLIEQMIEKVVEQKLSATIPEIIKSLGIQTAETEDVNLVDALEIAEILGRDTSTPKKARAAKLYVYNLARTGCIPSVRLSPKRIKFNPVAVRRKLIGEVA